MHTIQLYSQTVCYFMFCVCHDIYAVLCTYIYVLITSNAPTTTTTYYYFISLLFSIGGVYESSDKGRAASIGSISGYLFLYFYWLDDFTSMKQIYTLKYKEEFKQILISSSYRKFLLLVLCWLSEMYECINCKFLF